MQLGLYRREQLNGDDPRLIGSATVDQFQHTHGALQAWSEAEHKDDGTHANITADTLRVEGAVDLAGDVTIDGLLTINPEQGIQSGHVRFGQQPPIDPTFPNPATETLLVGGHLVPTGPAANLDQPFDLGHDLGVWRDLSVWRYLREKKGDRTLPLGYWTNNQGFNLSAADFTADPGATWTYTPDSGTCQWTHVGETTVLTIQIYGSVVGTAATASLYMNLPNAAVSSGNFGTVTRNAVALASATGPSSNTCLILANTATPGRLAFMRDLSGTPWPIGTVHIFGQITLCTTGDN